jgi:hypothetical protein
MQEFKNGIYINPSVQRIADNWDRKYLPLFQSVKNTWNKPIRNYYTKVMGVNLLDDETRSRSEIKISIKPISNKRILQLIDEVFGELDFEEYQKLKTFLHAAENVQPYFKESKKHSEQLSNLIEETKKRIGIFDIEELNRKLLKVLFDGETDIFGVYRAFFHARKGEIELYVIPCVLFCEANNLDLFTFVTMVMAHELAHGYNHLGIDKDNYFWESFPGTDRELIEGLAQYYTLEFLEKYITKLPKGTEIFYALLERQDDAYKTFENWHSTPEKTYSAFIETRRSNLTKYKDFVQLLEGAKIRIKGERIINPTISEPYV